jgi:hypothetical protein
MPRLSKIGAAALAAFGWTGLSSVTASYLVVAGGGGGGGQGNASGAGGAGGFLTGTSSLNPTLSYTVTVGAGGVGSTSSSARGSNGSNSVFNTATSIGGGGGGSQGSGVATGASGGSGGGGAGGNPGEAGGAGTSGQGFAGGAGLTDNTTYTAGGGGGGASAVGANAAFQVGGNGGTGTASSISGSSVTYAGGGGGGVNNSYTAGTGGSGGGGNGTNNPSTGGNGTANLGGGGGGSGNGNGGSGGSGIVIISYVGAQQFGGGVVTSSGGSTIHTFNTSGTLSPLSSLTASYLIVAGGAGGGSSGGGGGAGGYQTGSGTTIDTNSIYLVTVGAGGAGSTSSSVAGTNGSNSLFSAYATASVGGGGGGSVLGGAGNGVSGGSGGGATANTGTLFTGGAGTSGQGNAGGSNSNSPSSYGGGGGGGAGAVGTNGTSTLGGAGGVGLSSSISGTATFYAGGGGGGAFNGGGSGGTGGNGGGGNGSATTTNTAGTANLGGGGGGGGAIGGPVYYAGAAGGSGVVIISYAGSTQQMAGGTVTVAGGNVIHTFTSSGYLAPIFTANNSLRFRSSASAYLNRTPASAGNRQTWTWSAWVKRGTLGAYQGLFGQGTGTTASGYGFIRFDDNDVITISASPDGGTSSITWTSTPVYRDPSAWYHIVAVLDTTQATGSNRFKLYVNNVQQSGTFSTTPTQNSNIEINRAAAHQIGVVNAGSLNNYFDGYQTEINFIDGQALTPNSFGTSNGLGVWQPIRYGGSYGTNGFYLPFTNLSTISASYLVVAGGGGGGSDASNGTQAGGGGAGGYLTSTVTLPINGVFTVTVGGGGTGGTGSNSGSNGSDSVLSGSGISTITSTGGGRGGSRNTNSANSGGSGGGGAPSSVGTGTVGQGNDGGSGNSSGGGGGGGAGAVGGSTTAPNGGDGLQSSISGTSTYYAGGGAGRSGSSPFTQGTGGLGGGGNYGNAGTTNLGGGGGGGGGPGGKDGGSGVVIISYAGTPKFTGGTITQSGGNTIHTFTSSGTLGVGIAADYSPNGNNWTPNNISLTSGSTYDSMNDVPTLTSATTANYAVMNPLVSNGTITNGNLQVASSTTNGRTTIATIPASTTGSWYCEITPTGKTAGDYHIGVFGTTTTFSPFNPRLLYVGTGSVFNDSSNVATYATYTTNDVMGITYNASTKTASFYKNNTLQGSITTTSSEDMYFGVCGDSSGTSQNYAINFGQQPFVYTPPTGFLRLNTFNLPTPTIGATASTTANKYMDISLYSGNDANPRSITGVNFQPDFVWLKDRTQAANHRLVDVVRGAGKTLKSNTTDAETSSEALGTITAFTSDGFTVQGTSGVDGVNLSGDNYVAWNWKANGSGSTNTAGSITSTVSANTTAGFSIVTYTGTGVNATVGHGLGVAPSMVIVKAKNSPNSIDRPWAVYHSGLTSAAYVIFLNTTAAQASAPTYWNSTAPTSTVFSLGTEPVVNGATGTVGQYVAYCFTPIAGYSAFGKYTGNGVSDGPFIYTGFRPRFVMIKASGTTGAWSMTDTSRDPYNLTINKLEANTALSEASNAGLYQFDILSNGFKIRQGTGYGINDSADYIYMAFCESPFKYSNAR